MNNNKSDQISLNSSKPMTCESVIQHAVTKEMKICGSPFFEKNVILAKLSKLHNPNISQEYVEVEFLRCKYCRTILKETYPTEFEYLIKPNTNVNKKMEK